MFSVPYNLAEDFEKEGVAGPLVSAQERRERQSSGSTGKTPSGFIRWGFRLKPTNVIYTLREEAVRFSS